jgi:cytosine/adenosine deaminase-related metal-dependent hydrolase
VIRYHARWIVPITGAPVASGCVAVDEGRIAFVGSAREAPAGIDDDLGDAILLPGLVNAHTHLELTAFRGLLDDLPFREWIATLQSAKEAVMKPDDFLNAARLGVAEGLLAGVTTFADSCDSGVALRAMRELGARGIMYQEVFGPDPAQSDRAVADLRAKIDRLRADETPLQRLGVSPHAPYTVSDALFAAAAAYAGEAELPMAIHIAESDAEARLVRGAGGPFADALRARYIAAARRGRSPIEMLQRLGVLARRPLLIHCVHVDADDVNTIARADCPVAHCPASNAKLGHGIAPVTDMLAARIRVGLGSDSMASNDYMDLLAESRLALLAQRVRTKRHDTLSAAAALELATLGGARALGLDAEIGSLEPGKSADLVAFELDDLRATPTYDPSTALVFAHAPRTVRLSMVAGNVLVRDGRAQLFDPAVQSRVAETARRLADWKSRKPLDSRH